MHVQVFYAKFHPLQASCPPVPLLELLLRLIIVLLASWPTPELGRCTESQASRPSSRAHRTSLRLSHGDVRSDSDVVPHREVKAQAVGGKVSLGLAVDHHDMLQSGSIIALHPTIA
eukprot:1976401-Rhodomonas_salina.3